LNTLLIPCLFAAGRFISIATITHVNNPLFLQ
jgi:hypothetical protein